MKGRKIKCLAGFVTFTLAFIASLCFPTMAASYGKDYPPYLEQSASCFIECQTQLGRGTVVLPIDYCSDSLGFYGGNNQLMNITNSTISGYFVLSNGTTYDLRFSAFFTPQYYQQDSWQGRYYDLNVSQIYNTNCFLLDYTENDRQTDGLDWKSSQVWFVVIGLAVVLFIISTLVMAYRR